MFFPAMFALAVLTVPLPHRGVLPGAFRRSPMPFQIVEWAGLEVTGGWVNVNATPDFGDFGGEAPRGHSLGPAGTLRLLRMQAAAGVYLVPLEFSMGLGFRGAEGGFGTLGAEAGLLLEQSLLVPIELGATLGVGLIELKYSSHCDGPCVVGGGPGIFAPVVRARWPMGPLSFGVFVRAFLPMGSMNLTGIRRAWAMPILAGFDLGWLRTETGELR